MNLKYVKCVNNIWITLRHSKRPIKSFLPYPHNKGIVMREKQFIAFVWRKVIN